MGLFMKIYNKFLIAVNMPVILSEYFNKKTGEEYGLTFITKFILIFKMKMNNKRIITASNFLEHLIMATKIFNIPKSVEGCVVECGSYKGGSTANLSLVCDLTNRKLEVFDSFAGLPEPSDVDQSHILVNTSEVHTYEQGAFCGTLDEVKNNITQFGKINVCNFNVGYFDDTLWKFDKKCAFVFLDVDLRDSLETCVKFLWKLLQDGSCLFTHEAPHIEISSLFFEKQWWQDNFNSEPPGLIGAGNGLGLQPASGGFESCIGYTVKNPQAVSLRTVPQIGK
jgi:hypothetical protein